MKIFPLFLFLCLSVTSSARNPECITYTYGEEILAMVDDGDYLWLGTDGGLVKFNKRTEEKLFYNKANTSNGLMDNHIRALAIDSKKNLWVGTEYGGVSKFDGATWQNFRPDNSELPYEDVSCIAVDKNDRVFIGNGDYLTVYDGTIWRSFELGNPLLSFFGFNNIAFDSTNRAWITTKQSGASELFTYLNDTVSKIENDTTGFINSIVIDKENNIWCGSPSMGLLKFDGSQFEVYDTANSNIPSNNLSVFEIDENGNLWLLANGAVWRYEKGNCTEFRPNILLPPQNTFEPHSVILDHSGILWIGTLGEGLLKYDDKNWYKYKVSNSGLLNNFLNLIAIDSEGAVWIVFGQPRDSILNFDGRSWSFREKGDKKFWASNFELLYDSDSVQVWAGKNILIEFVQTQYNWAGVYNVKNHRHGTHIKLDKDGNFWQVSSRGLWKYDKYSWTLFNYSNTGIDFHSTGTVAFDDRGNLYANSDIGIIKYDGTHWEVYPRNIVLSDTLNHTISALEIDAAGNIWLGTANIWVSDVVLGEGLIRFDGTTLTRYNYHNSGMPNAEIFDLHFDNNDNLWIGTEGAGLIKFDCKDKWTAYNSDNSGIFSRFAVTPIEVDSHDNIWFGAWWGGLGVFREGGVILPTEVHHDQPRQIPRNIALFQNYPNPFNPATEIIYQTSEVRWVTLKVYDVIGREVRTLVNELKRPGEHQVKFDARSLASGVYFYTLKAGEFYSTKKMILIR